MGILEQAARMSEVLCQRMPDDECSLYNVCVGCPAKSVGIPLAEAGFRHHSDSAKEIFRDIELLISSKYEGYATWNEFWEQFKKLRELHEGEQKEYHI